MNSEYPFQMIKKSEHDHRIVFDDGKFLSFPKYLQAADCFSNLIRGHFKRAHGTELGISGKSENGVAPSRNEME